MIVVMREDSPEASIADVVERLTAAGCRVDRFDGDRVTLATAGGAPDRGALEGMPGVAAVLTGGAKPGVEGTRAGARVHDDAGTAMAHGDDRARGFDIGGHRIGAGDPFVVAGPCSVEDDETMDAIAAAVAAAGAVGLRAGAHKPRTSPYAFQGRGEAGLVTLRRAADAHGLLVVSEVLDATQIPVAARYCDILQVGARNMHNGTLLRELGRARRPVLLKRGMAATIEEWLGAAEYVASAGEPRVILCERGIRTFETATRNTLDLNAVAVARERTGLPVIVDPSHGTGRRSLVEALSLAALAAGADGLLIEAHVDPARALSDADQTIDTATLARIIARGRAVATALAAPAYGSFLNRNPTEVAWPVRTGT